MHPFVLGIMSMSIGPAALCFHYLFLQRLHFCISRKTNQQNTPVEFCLVWHIGLFAFFLKMEKIARFDLVSQIE